MQMRLFSIKFVLFTNIEDQTLERLFKDTIWATFF